MVPDWLPDCRDEGAYPAPHDLNLTSWAWQFLRRNPEYQRNVADWHELCKSSPTPGFLPSLDEDTRFWVADPPFKPGETYEEYWKRVKIHRGIKPLRKVLREKWGCWPRALFSGDTLADPADSEARVEFVTQETRFIDGDPRYNQRAAVVHPRAWDVWVPVNLQWDIGLQLERRKSALKDLVKSKIQVAGLVTTQKRLTRESYPKYLRVLDAEVAGYSPGETARILLPNTDDCYPGYFASNSIRDWQVAAKRLRDGDYLYIALREPRPPD